MVGLMERFGRQIAGKCVEGGDRHRNYPRYVATKAAFHLLGTSSGIKIETSWECCRIRASKRKRRSP